MLDNIQIGPFTFHGGKILKINSLPARRWRMGYNGQTLSEKVRESSSEKDALGITSYELLHFFEKERSDFVIKAQSEHGPERIDLIDYATGDVIAAFQSFDSCGMTPGLINDASPLWIRSSDNRRSRDVTVFEFARIVSKHEALSHGWIAGLLPDEVLTHDAAEWRSPTAWELRHVVGEGSFTGVTGAKAAEMVGVTPQNFRKYTARDGATTRQNMSFAMWHLLLHKLGVQRA